MKRLREVVISVIKIMGYLTMIFLFIIQPFKLYNESLRKDIILYQGYESELQAINELQHQQFNDYVREIHVQYGSHSKEYTFEYRVEAHRIGFDWIELNIIKKRIHRQTHVSIIEKETRLMHQNSLASYDTTPLKNSTHSLRLAQALHLYLNTRDVPLVVNVLKLQRFIQDENTTLTLTPKGLRIQTTQCQYSWCQSTQFSAVIDYDYLHDATLTHPSQFKDPIKEGTFISDSIIDPSLPMVAITFDDGPKPLSLKMNDILAQSNTKATLFWIGQEVKAHPQIAKTLFEAGHEIGNHTYHHPHLNEMSHDAVLKELESTDDIIEQTIGVRPTIMRPPYGELNHSDVDKISHTIIRWNLDTVDWSEPSHEVLLQSLMKCQDGDIILMHDVFKNTHGVVHEFIQSQLSKGVQFVKVSELIHHRSLTSHVVYGVRRPTRINP